MAYEAEERFVKVFVARGRQERLLFELTHPKKRYRGLDRFCHQAAELVDEDKILMRGPDLSRQPAFIRFVDEHRAICRVLSPDPALDGQELPFREAAARAFMGLDAAIVTAPGFALVVGEAEQGGRTAFLLTATGEKG